LAKPKHRLHKRLVVFFRDWQGISKQVNALSSRFFLPRQADHFYILNAVWLHSLYAASYVDFFAVRQQRPKDLHCVPLCFFDVHLVFVFVFLKGRQQKRRRPEMD
jgi:hypothetical protein